MAEAQTQAPADPVSRIQAILEAEKAPEPEKVEAAPEAAPEGEAQPEGEAKPEENKQVARMQATWAFLRETVAAQQGLLLPALPGAIASGP